jgi:hypothetical protein
MYIWCGVCDTSTFISHHTESWLVSSVNIFDVVFVTLAHSFHATLTLYHDLFWSINAYPVSYYFKCRQRQSHKRKLKQRLIIKRKNFVECWGLRLAELTRNYAYQRHCTSLSSWCKAFMHLGALLLFLLRSFSTQVDDLVCEIYFLDQPR